MGISIKELKDSTFKHTESAQKFKDQLSSTIVSSVKELKESTSKHTVNLPNPTKAISYVKSVDQRKNIIIFGLEEKSLSDKNKDVQSILEFLCGCPVSFSDALRLWLLQGKQQ